MCSYSYSFYLLRTFQLTYVYSFKHPKKNSLIKTCDCCSDNQKLKEKKKKKLKNKSPSTSHRTQHIVQLFLFFRSGWIWTQTQESHWCIHNQEAWLLSACRRNERILPPGTLCRNNNGNISKAAFYSQNPVDADNQTSKKRTHCYLWRHTDIMDWGHVRVRHSHTPRVQPWLRCVCVYV